MKILIVDDSKAMRMIVARTIKQAGFSGHKTIEANNGQEGFAVVAAEKPDVVLSDWNMPEMTGIEFLEKLRSGGSNVPFGFVTSESAPAIREKALGAGAAFLITKPFTPQAFEQALKPVLN